MKGNSFLIVSSYLPPEQSGSGYHALHFVSHLRESGYAAHVLSFNRNLKYKKQKKYITRIPYFNKGYFLKILSLPIILIYYLIYILRFRIIIIYGNQIIAYQFIILIARLFGRKIIFQSLLPGIDDLELILKHNNFFIRSLNKKLFELISVYFSISMLFSDIYKASNLKRPILFNSTQGVNTNFFKPVTNAEKSSLLKKLKLKYEKPIILSPGLLIRRKGFESLFSVLSKSKTDFLLIIVGQNSPENCILADKEKKEMIYLKNMGKSLLRDKIHFIGHVDNIHEYMQIADFLILYSENEGMPNVILEGLSCGLPIICRDLKGVSNYILHHNKNALLCQNEEEIEKHISFLINNKAEQERLGRNARNFAVQNLSFEKITNELLLCLKKGKLNE